MSIYITYKSNTTLQTHNVKKIISLHGVLKGNRSQFFIDMSVTKLIKSNNFQQQSYF